MEVDSSKLHLNAGDLTKQYPKDILPGHAAWLDWPYKLHRIQQIPDEIVIALYNLKDDPMEENDLAGEHESKVDAMKAQLQSWQISIIESLNGKDYR